MGKIFIYFYSALIDVNVKSCISHSKTYRCYVSDPICSPCFKRHKLNQLKINVCELKARLISSLQPQCRKEKSRKSVFFLRKKNKSSDYPAILLTSGTTLQFQQAKDALSNQSVRQVLVHGRFWKAS